MNPFDLIHEIYNIYLTISSYVETAQANKEQCQRLTNRLKIIVDTLMGLKEIKDTQSFCKALTELKAHIEECEKFIQEFTNKKGLMKIIKSGKYKEEFERLNRFLEEDLLQLNIGINVQQLMNHEDDELDRKKDAEDLLKKQDELLKLMTEESGKVEDVRQMLAGLASFLHEELHSLSRPTEVVDSLAEILIEAEEVECGREIAHGNKIIYQGRFRGQDVAIKTLGQDLDEAARRQFEREVRILRSLRSDQVVFFYGACLHAGKECLVMKYMANGALRDLIEKKTSFTPEQQKRIALEIAKGLQYLHNQKMIHRDLNDRHILFDEDMHAKLTGFGLSKVQSKVVQTVQITQEVSCWSAPELLGRRVAHSAKSDVYSYGLILWELLTWQKPYAGCSLDSRDLLEKVRSGYRENIPETVPKIYADLIRQCWDENPLKRPSLEVMIREIENYTPRPKSPTGEELYELGRNSDKARHGIEARDFYLRAVAKGNTPAKTSLGFLFWQGNGGVAQDKTKAFALTSEAAQAGDLRAQYNVAQMYEYGEGTAKDYEQALMWYRKVAAAGDDKEAEKRVQHLIEKMEKQHLRM